MYPLHVVLLAVCLIFTNARAQTDAGVVEISEMGDSLESVPRRAIDRELPNTRPTRDNACKDVIAGRGWTVAGTVCHFSGLALSAVAVPVLYSELGSASSFPTGALIMTLASGALKNFGPIASCAGGSTVQDAMENVNISFPWESGWSHYSTAWGFAAGSTVVNIAGFFVGSMVESTPVIVISGIGSLALSIVAEVHFILACVEPLKYANAAVEECSRRHRFSYRLTPTYEQCNGDPAPGLALSVRF